MSVRFADLGGPGLGGSRLSLLHPLISPPGFGQRTRNPAGCLVRHDEAVPAVDFELHRLGWRAFQDLAAVVLQQVLGQTMQVFADSNDAGRDGAFHGVWCSNPAEDSALAPEVDAAAGDRPTVVQCKFSGSGDGTLPPSALSDEVAKAARLHQQGICDAYLLVTNLRVTGATDQWLREKLAESGISRTLVLDGPWISRVITLSPTLRRYVPRVYGLGDLSLILDERRVQQAHALLARLREDLVTFVPTAAYRAAADAIAQHGFVLLLGEPASGKSTIAATLSVAALDEWGSQVMRVSSPDELVAAWNPHESRQLFWVDDAFGTIRHDPRLTDSWARRLDRVMTAVAGGARIILTSRDYIYREARPHLKEYAYPRLREQQVAVDIEALTSDEKRRVLYNHLKAGNQPGEVLRGWQPHLPAIADVTPFRPEVARRLGLQAFTGDRLHNREQLVDFMRRPTEFLRDVFGELDAGARAALGCVYVRGEHGLQSPVTLNTTLTHVIARLGATLEQVLPAFSRLDGTFLRLDSQGGQPTWQFRHPTLREGFAASVTGQPDMVGILLDGLTDAELLQQVDCGGHARGTLVTVPPALYRSVAARIPVVGTGERLWTNPVGTFLMSRTSEEFVRVWAAEHASDLPRLLSFGLYVEAHWQPKVLARLHNAGALPEQLRQQAVRKLTQYARDHLDPGWLRPHIRLLLTDQEVADELSFFKEHVLPEIDGFIEQSADGWDDDVTPDQRYDVAKDAVRLYREACQEDPAVIAALDRAAASIDAAIQHAEYNHPPTEEPLAGDDRHFRSVAAAHGRDEFDDVDHGH